MPNTEISKMSKTTKDNLCRLISIIRGLRKQVSGLEQNLSGNRTRLQNLSSIINCYVEFVVEMRRFSNRKKVVDKSFRSFLMALDGKVNLLKETMKNEDWWYDHSGEEQNWNDLEHEEQSKAEATGKCPRCGAKLVKVHLVYSKDYLNMRTEDGANPCIPWFELKCPNKECGAGWLSGYDVIT